MSDNGNKITLTIDGRQVTVDRGTTVLEAARSIGIDIPTFCWHPKLKSVGACRMCYVEIEKFRTLAVSCATECLPDMVVHTRSEKVLQGRKAVLEFILLNHPLDCPTCDKGGECDLQDHTFAHGIDDSRFDFPKYRFKRDPKSTFDDYRIGPEIIRNQNRCILCYKCVRANKEIFGEHDLGVFQRGNLAEIDAAPGEKVDSLYSGNLVEICPVGALTNTDFRYKVRVWKTKQVKSICQYCADGCNLTLWARRNRIFRATSRRNDDIDEGWICDRGRYGYQVANAEDRLTTPLVKKGEHHVEVTWDEAIKTIAARFREIKDKKGGVCIGGLAYPGLDSASLYTVSKFFRTILNTNSIDFRYDYKMLPEKAGDVYSEMTAQPFSITGIEKSDLILVLASHLINEHPITHLRVRKAVTKLGSKLYTVNPFATKSGDISTDEIIYRLGTLEALINGVCMALTEQSNEIKTKYADKLKSLIAPSSVEAASKISGVEKERIHNLARAILDAKNVTVIVGEILTGSATRENMASAISNMLLISGIPAKGQVGFLSKYANSMGAQRLGVMPHLPDATVERLKELWDNYPEQPGLAADRILLAGRKEEIDSIFVMGCDPLLLYPDGEFVRESLETLDFLVVADMFESKTTAMADVVLPLAGPAEMSGSFVNIEGRIQTFDKAINPPGQALPGYEIMNRLAAEMKNPLYESDRQLHDEITMLLDMNHKAPAIMDVQEAKYIAEEPGDEYNIALVVTDELHHFGHLTEKTKSLSAFCAESFLEISPALAEKYHAQNGTLLRVESEVGKVILPVRISEHIDNNVAMIYKNFAATPVNVLQMRKRRVDYVRLSRVEEK